MGTLLTIDPGKCSGWASWHNGTLEICGVFFPRFTNYPCLASYSDTVVIEIPQVYRARHLKGDPQDLIGLAIQAGRIEGLLLAVSPDTTVEMILPAQWAKQVPKEIRAARSKKKLTPIERRCVPPNLPEYQVHNMWDAIGIGLWWLRKVRP